MGRPKKNKEPVEPIEPEVAIPAKEKEGTGFKALMKALEKNYGVGSLAQANTIFDIAKIKTKVLLLDILLKGGIPTSSIITFYGAESTGKSLFSYIFGSVFTDKKQRIAIIDCEHAVDRPWLKKLGLDLDYVYIAQPKSLERAIDITIACLDSREFGLIIFDSLTSAIPIEEMEKSAESQQMALQARLFSKMFKKVNSALQPEDLTDETTYNKTIFIGIGQLREKVGFVMGNPQILPGGFSVKHHSHYILKFSKGQVLTINKEPIGREVRVKVEKAKYSPPLVSGVMEFRFDPPKVNNAKVLITYATQYGIIKRAGAWFEYREIKECGAEKLLIKIKEEHPEYLDEIKQSLIEYDGSKKVEEEVTENE